MTHFVSGGTYYLTSINQSSVSPDGSWYHYNYLMNGFSSLDETYKVWSAPTDDLIRFWRSKVKAVEVRKASTWH